MIGDINTNILNKFHNLKIKDFVIVMINPFTAKLFNLNFHPLEVVSR